MALPTINDFIQYIGTLLTGNNWNTNFQKIVDILTNGTYDLKVNQVTATTYIGAPGSQISTLIAGESITKGQLCYLKISDAKLYVADQSSVATADTCLGVAIDSYDSGSAVILETSFYTEYSGLTPGYYYLGTVGQIVSTAPSTGVIKPIGLAVSTTSIKLCIMPLNSVYYGAGWTHIVSGNDVVLKYLGAEGDRWIP